jgi:hypothetical protein
VRARLLFLGAAGETDRPRRILVPPALRVGDPLPLQLRHHQRWRRQDVTRVILGSDPTWADLVLVDEPLRIAREHARFYLNHRAPDNSDLRPMKQCPVIINGRLRPPFEWINIHNGDQIELAGWRFGYEWQPD